jgi:hypothetical protein
MHQSLIHTCFECFFNRQKEFFVNFWTNIIKQIVIWSTVKMPFSNELVFFFQRNVKMAGANLIKLFISALMLS